jgi:hypothetical protein
MCDSGKYHEAIYDARGIYVGKVSEDCREETLGGFRKEIFSDPQYQTDEPIDED